MEIRRVENVFQTELSGRYSRDNSGRWRLLVEIFEIRDDFKQELETAHQKLLAEEILRGRANEEIQR